jgi:cytochrome c-type biogenesis protein CcmH/NrfG
MGSLKQILAVIILSLIPGFLTAFASVAPSAEALLAQGHVDEAITSLRHQISGTPDDAQSYNLLCRAFLVLENWDAGIPACQKAVALDPGNSQYHLWLGRIYGEKASHAGFISAAGLAEKVRHEFENAVRLDPGNVEARADLAQFYVEAPGIVGGGKDKAAAQAREMATLDPPQAHLVQAWIAEKNKDRAAAESEYRAAIDTSGGNAGPWLSLAQFYRRAGRLDAMQDALQHALAARKNQHILMSAADVLVRTKGDLPRAVQVLRLYLANGTVEEAPAFKAHYLLGTLLERTGDKLAAAQEYRAALSLASGFSPARSALDRLNRQEPQPVSAPGTE